MNITLSWNAVQTRTNCEKKVISQLEKRGITYYFPLNQPATDNLKQQKSVAGPLFPSIIFIQLPADFPLLSLTQIPYVTNLLYWRHSPAVFPAIEINQLRNFVDMYKTIRVTKTCLNGALHTEELRRIQYNAADTVYTMDLPSMGYSLEARTDTVTSIRLVRKNTPHYRVTDSLASILGFRTNR